jgi:hypothetical protein
MLMERDCKAKRDLLKYTPFLGQVLARNDAGGSWNSRDWDKHGRRGLALNATIVTGGFLGACATISGESQRRAVLAESSRIVSKYKLAYIGWGGEHDQNSVGLSYNLPRVRYAYEQADALRLVDKALRKYSPEALNNIGHFGFIFPEEIWHWNGETQEWEDYGGTVLDYGGQFDVIVLSTSGISERSLHHEMYHLVDSRDSGGDDILLENMTANTGLSYYPDLPYEDARKCSSKSAGFAECYGQWNTDEDGATIAERLMTGNKDLWKKSKDDLTLQAKISIVIEQYKWISAGKMDREFFENLRDRKIPGNYWGW